MVSLNLSKRICVGGAVISEEDRPFIVGEMACAHEGDAERGEKLIDVAVSGGADAIQFQLFDLYENMAPQSDIFPLLKKLYMPPEKWKRLFEYARKYDIAVSAFAYDTISLGIALELGADMIKLNSSDLSNPDMIRGIADSGLPCTIGTGASTMEEITRSLELFLESGGDKLILIHGVQNFPTEIPNLHIRRMGLLRSAFDSLVGYADHTDAGTPLSRVIDLVAVGMGASVVEKHITLDRSEKGTDHESALEPSEFADYVSLIRDAHMAMGPKRIKSLNESDFKYRLFQKKSVFAAKDLKAGESLTKDKIKFMRSSKGQGISPMEEDKILGGRLKADIRQHEPIKGEMVETGVGA